jgi:ribosomal protein S18 acetylase RimI-like enzyme
MMVLSRIESDGLHEVDALFDRLVNYSLAVDGVVRRPQAGADFATSLPPGKTSANKHVFIVRNGDEPVGLLDIIENYPAERVAFIGLLAIAEDRHGVGLGKAAFLMAERFALEELHARTLRLAVISSNPVVGFWEKMGFSKTGDVRPYEGEAQSATVVLMEKSLG